MAVTRFAFVCVASLLIIAAAAGGDHHDDNVAHIQQHMNDAGYDFEDVYNDDIYYFTLHDTNSDGNLDGHEMRVALLDSHMHQKTQKTLQQAETRVDEILAKDDRNGDGMISFSEFNLFSFYQKF